MTQIDRDALRSQFEALLNDADEETGEMDAARFWVFVSDLAQGRGVDTELAAAATDLVVEHGVPEDPAELWRSYQGAVLFHLIQRLHLGGRSGVFPKDILDAPSLLAHALNLARGDAQLPELLAHRSKQGPRPMGTLARQRLVGAVVFLAEKEGISEAEARRRLLPPEGHPTEEDRLNTGFYSTWLNWKKKAEASGVVERAKSAAKGFVDPGPFDLSKDEITQAWEFALARRPK